MCLKHPPTQRSAAASSARTLLAILIPCHRVTRGREVPVEYVGGAAQRQRLLQFERP